MARSAAKTADMVYFTGRFVETSQCVESLTEVFLFGGSPYTTRVLDDPGGVDDVTEPSRMSDLAICEAEPPSNGITHGRVSATLM